MHKNYKTCFYRMGFGLVEIVLKENDRNITLTMQGNSRGLPNGFNIENEEGFGLMLIKMLTQQLDGSYTIVNSYSFSWIITQIAL